MPSDQPAIPWAPLVLVTLERFTVPPETSTPAHAPEIEVDPDEVWTVPPATWTPPRRAEPIVLDPERFTVPVTAAADEMPAVNMPVVVRPETFTVPLPETNPRPAVAGAPFELSATLVRPSVPVKFVSPTSVVAPVIVVLEKLAPPE